MAKKNFPLSIVIGTIDRATGPLARITSKFDRALTRMGLPLAKVQRSLGTLARAAKFDRIAGAVGNLTSRTRDLGRTLASTATKMLVLGGIAAGVAGKLIHGYAATGDAAAKAAQKIGVGVEWYQEWEFAAKQAGVKQEQFALGLKTFSKNFGLAAAGTGEAMSALNALGVAIKDNNGHTRDSSDAFEEVFQKLSALEDVNLRNALASRIFGEGGMEMGAMLEAGVASIDKARARARELGIVLSEETTAASTAFVDTWAELTASIGGARNSLLAPILPVLTERLQALTAWIVKNQDRFREWGVWLADRLPGAIKKTREGLERIWKATEPVRKVFGWLSDRFGTVTVVVGVLAAVLLGPLVASVLSVTGAFLKLGFVLATNPLGLILLGIAAVIAGIVIFRKEIAAFGSWLWGWAKKIGSGIWTGLKWPFTELPRIVARGAVGVVKWLGGLLEKIGSLWSPVADVLTWPFRALWDFVGSVFDWISEKVGSVFGWISDKVSALTGWLPDWVKSRLGLGGDVRVQLDDREIQRANATASTVRHESSVRVDFSNLPKGARLVDRRDGGVPLDLSMGYAMTTPG